MKRFIATCLSLLFAVVIVHAGQPRWPTPGPSSACSSRSVFSNRSPISPSNPFPRWLLERAYGVVVVPRVVKVALTIGGRGGRGVMAVRNPDGTW